MATVTAVTPWGGPLLRAQARFGVAAPIEDPTGNLTPRFRSLCAEADTRLVRLSFWGTSHTASDQYTSVLRDRLQRRFGDGGAGAFLPAIPMTFYDRWDVAFETAAGFVGVSTRGTRGTLVLGALGMALDARRAATARVRVRHPAVGTAKVWATGIGPERGRVALAIGARRVERDVELGETAMLELPLSDCPRETATSEACASEVQPRIDVEAHRTRVVALSTEASRGGVVESFAGGYALGDHVHLTDAGHQRLGEVLDAALQGRP